MDSEWVVLWAAAALLVRIGQLFSSLGMARAKNVASTGLRSLADFCVTTLCFWAIGAAILFQSNNPYFGFSGSDLIGWNGLSGNWFAMLVLVLIGTGMIPPVLAERSRLRIGLIVSGALAAVLIPIVLHWTRIGWLARRGFIDSGAAAALHVTPSICAAVAAMFVGAREGKYNRDGSSNMIPGHSVAWVIASVLMTLCGWVPYVISAAPSAASNLVAANLLLAASAGGLASLIFAQIRFGKVDVLLVCSGIVGGLVSITAGAGYIATPGAVLVGLVAGVLVPWLMIAIDLRFKIDDPGGIIAIHGIGGVWGLLAAPILSNRFADLLIQLLGVVTIVLVSLIFSIVLMLILRACFKLRVTEADEFDGLDLAEHDINAHPDFQQTMIKSYHLREA
ncbi:MAG TPA: hypothetical protein VHD56_10625 [Tepidisphaeraceae bacterium]|nr:hypothetical protein [Tepidisphaeraceae bacterium]